MKERGLVTQLKGLFTPSNWTDKAFMQNEVRKGFVNVATDKYRGVQGNGLWFFQPDGRDVYFDYTGLKSSLTAYQSCPPLAAIINRKAQAFINGKTWIVKAKGKGKEKEAAGEVAMRINKLLAKPNPLQSWRQFEAQNYIYQQIAGFCVVLPIKPVGFDNTYATKLWNIPPAFLEVVQKPNANLLIAKSVKDLIQSISFVYGGYSTLLPLDDVIIFNDFTPSLDNITLSESRTRSLSMNLNNILGSLESRGVLIDKRGPSMVVSSGKTDDSGEIPLTSKEKLALQDEFAERYGLMRNQSRAIITNVPIKVDTVGFSTRDLMLFEEMEDDIMRICDSYGYPYQLLSSAQGTTFANMNEGKKLLYQDSIIPEADNIYEQWNEAFNLPFYDLRIEKDYSHVAALQEDRVKLAQARYQRNQAAVIEFQNNVITLNDWRLANDEDPITEDWGSMYYFQLLEKGISFGKSPAAPKSNADQNNQDGNNAEQEQNVG